jgi:very-short-patch-repair endonuclease
MCNSRRLCDNEDCQSCREKSFASHEKSKYWSDKNVDENGNKIIPRHVFKSSGKKYLFNCDCGHIFESTLNHITAIHPTWCPYCCNPPIKLCEKEECQRCHETSFASHEKSKYWSDKNGDIKQREVFKSANTKYWFTCDCGHNFESKLNNITGNERWCPYCASQKLCEKEECKRCHEKSFASHEKSKYWSDKNGDVKPREVFKSANTKYWFTCHCGHDFESSLNDISRLIPSWCPYCSNPSKKLCDNKDCQSCHEKSFASHEKSKYWSDKNGNVKPRQVFKSSNIKYWFTGECGHDFENILHNITGLNQWCPICVNKTEKKLYEHLLKIYPNSIYRFSADWCKNLITKCCLPFDFVLKEQKIIIELDGPQHFVQVSNWKSPEEQFENDQYKEKCANDNGYSVIRIIQKDVWNDTYDWLNELKDSIEQIVNEKVIQNIYLCMNNEYDSFN